MPPYHAQGPHQVTLRVAVMRNTHQGEALMQKHSTASKAGLNVARPRFQQMPSR